MHQKDAPELEWIKQALNAVTEGSELLFERASVMMHSINREGRLVKVNRLWLATLGYDKDEVIGQKSVDFMTDESRLLAIQDTLPRFWQAGSDRSIRYGFLRKNGRVLNLLLDAEAVSGTEGELSGLATLRTSDSFDQWRQGSTTLRRLRTLYRLRRQLEELLLPEGDGVQDTGDPGES